MSSPVYRDQQQNIILSRMLVLSYPGPFEDTSFGGDIVAALRLNCIVLYFCCGAWSFGSVLMPCIGEAKSSLVQSLRWILGLLLLESIYSVSCTYGGGLVGYIIIYFIGPLWLLRPRSRSELKIVPHSQRSCVNGLVARAIFLGAPLSLIPQFIMPHLLKVNKLPASIFIF
jgi:hypothetical protein